MTETMENGLQCTGCGRGGFQELNGKYRKGDETIIHQGEALCDECACQREGFEPITNNEKATTNHE